MLPGQVIRDVTHKINMLYRIPLRKCGVYRPFCSLSQVDPHCFYLAKQALYPTTPVTEVSVCSYLNGTLLWAGCARLQRSYHPFSQILMLWSHLYSTCLNYVTHTPSEKPKLVQCSPNFQYLPLLVPSGFTC